MMCILLRQLSVEDNLCDVCLFEEYQTFVACMKVETRCGKLHDTLDGGNRSRHFDGRECGKRGYMQDFYDCFDMRMIID